MDIRHFKLSQTQEWELEQAERACNDVEERRRMQMVRLYGTGERLETIKKTVQASERTITRWVERYRADGIAGLARATTVGNHRILSVEQRELVVTTVREQTPTHVGVSGREQWSVAAVAALVRQRFGLDYAAPSGYRALLYDAGLSYQKVAKVYRHRPSQTDIADWQADTEKK